MYDECKRLIEYREELLFLYKNHFEDMKKDVENRIFSFQDGYMEKKFHTDDNYANHPHYGERPGDRENAKRHAYYMLHCLSKTDVSSREELKRKLVHDVRNYLLCTVKRWKKSPRASAVFIRALVFCDCEQDLIDIVHECYRTLYRLFDEIHYLPLEYFYETELFLFRDDIRSILMDAGDRALFVKQDANLAVRLYDLVRQEYDFISDSVDYYDDVKLSNKMLDKLRKKREELNSDYEELIDFLMTYHDISNQRLDFFDDSHQRFSMKDDDQTLKHDELRRLKNSVENNNGRKMYSRILAIWIGILRDRYLVPMLILFDDSEISEELTFGQKRDILRACRLSKNTYFKKLKLLHSDEEDNGEQWTKVRKFAKSLYCVNGIYDTLRVPEGYLFPYLGYYTSIDTFFYVLPESNEDHVEHYGKPSVMNISYMNDPNEGKLLLTYFFGSDYDRCSDSGRKRLNVPWVFLKSFTTNLDYLPMWEIYGDQAQGCCVCLEGDTFVANREPSLYFVCYVTDDEEITVSHDNNPYLEESMCHSIKAFLDELKQLSEYFSDVEVFAQILDRILYLFKDVSYSYEREVRVLYTESELPSEMLLTHPKRNEEIWPKLFVRMEVPLHIKELILGPRFDSAEQKIPYLQKQLEVMSEALGMEPPKITRSKIEYR